MMQTKATPQRSLERSSLTGRGRFARVFFRRKVVLFGLVVLVLYVIMAIFAEWIAPYDPYAIDVSNLRALPSSEHLLGTDIVGRDILSRLIFAVRPTLIIALGAISIGITIGTALGLIAGYFGGWVETIIMRFIDALMGIPRVLLAFVIAAGLGGGMQSLIIALGIGMIAAPARVMCGQTLSIKENDYIMAGRSLGFGNQRLMWRHIIPNAFPAMLIMSVMEIGRVVLMEAGLSYLGIGLKPPLAAWGSMISDGQKYLASLPALSVAPGIALILLVFSVNMVADGLRDALDPRLRGTL